MELETKYSLNQPVWKIENKRKQVVADCPTCEGTGEVVINNTSPRGCPDCYGRCTNSSWEPTRWIVGGLPMKIGQVRCEVTSIEKTGIFDNIGVYNPDEIEQKIEYMCYETGVGSGTLHKEKDFFITKEETQTECDIRNKTNS